METNSRSGELTDAAKARIERAKYLASPDYSRWQRQRRFASYLLGSHLAAQRQTFEFMQNVLTTAVVAGIFLYTAPTEWEHREGAGLKNFMCGLALAGLGLLALRLLWAAFFIALHFGVVATIDLADFGNIQFGKEFARWLGRTVGVSILGGLVLLGAVIGKQAGKAQRAPQGAQDCQINM